jgi:hypothetical protein
MEPPLTLSRRLLVRCLALAAAALGAVAGLTRRARAASPASEPQGGTPRELPGLTVRKLLPLAYAVLPSELGPARTERAAVAFARWIARYREGEETVHPYGSDRLGVTGPSPAARWAQQLAQLDADARAANAMPFEELSRAERSSLVQAALAGVQFTARVPSPAAAPHVALGLLAHFLDSADATNLAYGRVIDPLTCRPLANSPRQPVALQRAGRGS